MPGLGTVLTSTLPLLGLTALRAVMSVDLHKLSARELKLSMFFSFVYGVIAGLIIGVLL